MSVKLQTVVLNKNADRRLRAGHSWIYSNEIDTKFSSLGNFEQGEQVDVVNSQGKWLGSGYINPNSLICVRVLNRNKQVRIDGSLLVHRLKIALSLRDRFYQKPFYRWVFGESDGLPGLIVDRYGDYCVVAISTWGMERLIDEILYAVTKVLKPAGILFRNDSTARQQEGLERYIEIASGDIPELVRLSEGQSEFDVSLFEGQKTGWFFDQEANRKRMLKYIRGKTVLDVCSYVGAWSVQAALAGAKSVTSIDISASALEQLEKNAQLNAVNGKISCMQSDAFKAMKTLKDDFNKYDVVILDPPAFMKRRKDIKQGLTAYRRLNEMALRLLQNDGVLISASCSHHLAKSELLKVIQQSARHTDRVVQVLEEGRQGIDHPVHPAIVETEYLKAYYCRVLSSF